jgi:hypothetical protein
MGWVTLDERGPGGPDWQHDPWDDPDVTDALIVEPSRRASWYVRWAVYSLFVILTVGVLAAGSLGWWYLNEINPKGDPGIAVNFTVNPGETVDSLSVRLQDDGFISNARVFRWYVERQGGLELNGLVDGADAVAQVFGRGPGDADAPGEEPPGRHPEERPAPQQQAPAEEGGRRDGAPVRAPEPVAHPVDAGRGWGDGVIHTRHVLDLEVALAPDRAQALQDADARPAVARHLERGGVGLPGADLQQRVARALGEHLEAQGAVEPLNEARRALKQRLGGSQGAKEGPIGPEALAGVALVAGAPPALPEGVVPRRDLRPAGEAALHPEHEVVVKPVGDPAVEVKEALPGEPGLGAGLGDHGGAVGAL